MVVTLSPQTIASLAAFMNSTSVVETFLRLATYLKSLGVRYVIDAAAGGDVVLLEAREEFVTRSVSHALGLSLESLCHSATLSLCHCVFVAVPLSCYLW